MTRAKQILSIAIAAAAIATPIGFRVMFGQVSKSLARMTTREFDAVSVKPMQQKGERFAMTWHVDPKMVDISAEPLQTYVEQAYGLKPYQVVLSMRRSDWVSSERYDIQAHVEQPATQDEMMLMLRKALGDRFHLRVHVETREMPVYFLTVDRRGAKLREATMNTGPNLAVHRNEVIATHLAMEGLAGVLSEFVTDQPVVDRTALKLEYQFKLEFAPSSTPDDVATGPSIYTALTEQLGLKLQAGKAPVEVLVIDGAERPLPN